MGGVGASVGVAHAVGIAVVREDKEAVPVRKTSFNNRLGALVHGFAGLNGRFEHAGMAHHVGVGKVEADEVGFAAFEFGNQCIPELKCAHLGLKVVGGHFGRGAKDSGFTVKGLFASA